jgi:hypothetical protein
MRVPLDTIASPGDVHAGRPRAREGDAPFASLDDLRVASPCTADWDRMAGDAVVRFCPQCRQNVYNLSGMTADEATALLRENERTPCVRFYRRRDGTVMTADCPVGIRRLARSTWRLAAVSLSAVFAVLMGILGWGMRQQTSHMSGGGACNGVTMGKPVPAAVSRGPDGQRPDAEKGGEVDVPRR